MAYSCGVLTVSDRGARGERQDTGGEWLKEALAASGFICRAYAVVPDEQPIISATLIDWLDRQAIDLILTTGGTGVSPRDVTPEATTAVVERLVPGIPELIRQAGYQKTVNAILSRGIAGIRGAGLVVNLPGSLIALQESIGLFLPAIPHALAKIKGSTAECGRSE